MRSLIFILLAHLSLAQIAINGTCETDNQCGSFCCTNNLDYSIEGICAEVDEEPRCEQRKRNDHIGLVCSLLVIWIVVIACGIAKVK